MGRKFSCISYGMGVSAPHILLQKDFIHRMVLVRTSCLIIFRLKGNRTLRVMVLVLILFVVNTPCLVLLLLGVGYCYC